MTAVLTSKNIKDELENAIKNKSWLEVYDSFSKRIVDEDEENYLALKNGVFHYFIYLAIEKEIPQKEFDEIIKKIYQELPNDYSGLGRFFNAFFNYRDTDLTFRGYILDRENKDENISDKIYYTFLDEENKKVIFNKKRLPYLLSMLENIPEDKIDSLYEGKFSIYCGYDFLTNNVKELEPIFNLKNPAFNIQKERDFGKLNETVLSLIARGSYEKTNEINKQMFKDLSEIVPSFEDVYLNAMYSIKEDFRGYAVEINNSLANFARFGEINIFDRLLELHKESLRKTEATGGDYSISVTSSIEVYLEKFDMSRVDFNKINVHEDIKENLIFIPLINIAILQDTKLDLSSEVMNYILNSFENESNKRNRINYYLEDFKDSFKKFFQSCELEKQLKVNNKKTNKVKL